MQKVKLSSRELLFLRLLFGPKRPKLSAIGQKLGMSKEMATYTLTKLEKNGVFKGLIPIVNYTALGFSTYRLLIKLTPEAFAKKDEIIVQLKSLPFLSWMVNIEGPHDIALLFLVKDAPSFNRIYEKIARDFTAQIAGMKIHIIQSITHLLPFEKKDSWNATTSGSVSSVLFDKLDEEIITALLMGSWKSLLTVAQQLGVSFNTVKSRLRLLESNNVIIGYKPLIDYEKLGLQHVKVMLDCPNMTYVKHIEQRLMQIQQVSYITYSVGPFDLEFECECESMQEVVDIIHQLKTEAAITDYQMYFTNLEILIGLFGADTLTPQTSVGGSQK